MRTTHVTVTTAHFLTFTRDKIKSCYPLSSIQFSPSPLSLLFPSCLCTHNTISIVIVIMSSRMMMMMMMMIFFILPLMLSRFLPAHNNKVIQVKSQSLFLSLKNDSLEPPEINRIEFFPTHFVHFPLFLSVLRNEHEKLTLLSPRMVYLYQMDGHSLSV